MIGRLCGAAMAFVTCALVCLVTNAAEAGPLRAIGRGTLGLGRGVANAVGHRLDRRREGDLLRQRAFRFIFGTGGGCDAAGGCEAGTCPVEAPKAETVNPGAASDPPG